MKIAIAQMNCMVGDIAGNTRQILDYSADAKAKGATLLLTPELSLCGYPPEDLLLRDDFYKPAMLHCSIWLKRSQILP